MDNEILRADANLAKTKFAHGYYSILPQEYDATPESIPTTLKKWEMTRELPSREHNNLQQSIRERKIQFTNRVLAVVDGSKALEKSTRKFFTSVDVQLCYLHKLRNILAKLPRKYHGEFVRKYRQAFNVNDFDDALEAMNALLSWLESVSFSAAESLREGLERLLTLHRIKMDPPLRKSFYTTNLIDSAFSNPRSHLNRVKRTQGKTDQALRWVGALLLEQEKQFRKVRAFKNINKFLVKYLEKPVAEKMAV